MVSTDVSTAAPAVDDVAGRAHSFDARRLSIAGIVAVLLALAWFAWNRRWMSDDGFIYLRVVQNLRAGHGPVFNPGERVEAATGPAWVALLAFFDLITPFRLESIAIVLGIACTLLGCAAVSMAAMHLHNDVPKRQTLFVPFGLVTIAAIPATWDYATSGLETGLALAWIGVTFLLLVRWAAEPGWRTRRVPRSLAVAVGAGALVRPDLLLFSIAFLAVLLVPRTDIRPTSHRARVLAIACALPFAYEVFRAGYYAALVPNSAFAKEGTTLRISQGIRYAKNFLYTYWLIIPATAIAVALVALVRHLWRTGGDGLAAVVVACVVAGFADALYTVAVGGSHMHARLFLPALLACVAPVAVVPWGSIRPAIVTVLVWAAVCAVALRPPGLPKEKMLRFESMTPTVLRNGVVDLRSFFTITTGDPNPVSIGSHIRAIAPKFRQVQVTPNGKVVDPPFGLVGAVAYYNGPSVYTFDRLALGDWLTARLPLDLHRFPDHQKYTSAWLPARLSEVTGEPATPAWPVTVAALHALDCGDLRELREATTADLDAGRFVANLWDAVRLQSFRVSANPFAAERKLCH